MRYSSNIVSTAPTSRLWVMAILLCWFLFGQAVAQTDGSASRVLFAEVTRWHDSLMTLQAANLIPKSYSSWQKLYERTLAEYHRDSTSSTYHKKAQQCGPEFEKLEPLAFIAHYLASVDSSLNSATSAGAKDFAPMTLSRAKMYRAKSASALRENRDDLREASLERSRADYEARHALTMTQQIKPLADQKNSCEHALLHSESQLQRLGATLGVQLRFADGSDSPADELADAIAELKIVRQNTIEKLVRVDSSLQQIFAELGIYPPVGEGSEALVTALSEEFRHLVRELDDSKRELRQYRQRVLNLKQEKETAETILSSKEAEERRFAQTRALFNSDEAITLYNGSHDIVIRLRGITFPSGVALLSKAHDSLLAKVTEALELYPSAQVIVEGHTDNTGGAKLNVRLSEKRALAVMKYLLASTGRTEGNFKSVGYGAEKPVANNQTKHGRKENRRIDIIIVR